MQEYALLHNSLTIKKNIFSHATRLRRVFLELSAFSKTKKINLPFYRLFNKNIVKIHYNMG